MCREPLDIPDYTCGIRMFLDALTDPQTGAIRSLGEIEAVGFKTVLAWYNSVGGLKVDTDCRVIGTDFNPIPGLYAAGSDAGGLFGACYDVVVAPASCQAWARASGKWAAEHAVQGYIPSLA